MGATKIKTTETVAAALKPSDFVHLHNHTHHSLLDGLTKMPDLMEKVKSFGMEAVAMTDHGTMSGAIEFYKEARGAGVKPIIGMEAYVAARSRFDRDPAKDKARYHLTLLAMNETGYKNLMLLATKASLEGMYYKPRIDHELLEQHGEGLIVLSGCASGEIGENLRAGNFEEAKRIAEWYKSVFNDRYYLELQDHGHPDSPSLWDVQTLINDGLERISKETGIPCVVTSDGHYLLHDDRNTHEILLCVGTGAFLSDANRMSLKEFELHVTDPADIIKRWSNKNPEAVANTRRIADRCSVEIELGKILIPKFPTPKGDDEKSYLQKLTWEGLAVRYGKVSSEEAEKLSEADIRKFLPETIISRSEYELSVMNSMGYNGYFLIVQDFINWGKDRGIIFGPGRGSAAGSIVAYALRITEVDPMFYGLMFERFLNPNRISMPDIDIDIQDTRRDEVIAYCANKYGESKVANIVTFGRMAARAAVRDVARVLQVPYAEADRLSKMIPPPVQGRHIPLKRSVQEDADLKREYETNPIAKEVFDYAMRLEGTIRSHGVHAAGVVIAPDDIVNYVPLEMAQKGVVATQYPMGPVEELGLLKMDFLGLSNLTTLKNALRIIKKVYQTDIDLGLLPNDDEKTLELFRRGDTTGVFQFESAGMKRYLRELKPTEFADLVAMNALYRPGPMAEIPRFIAGKNDAGTITFLHDSLEPVLGDTYGVMVYQEQIINLLQLIAGYTPGEADLVRKAIGKKKRDIMEAEEPKFIAGCKKQGLTETAAKTLWAQIQPFADYSFNKAHATCYSQIAYWTAYLKANYPDAFMAALMTSDNDDIDRLAIEINECKHMGIDVLSPDVNESFGEFGVVPGQNAIRFGMTAVKGVGAGAAEEIIKARGDENFSNIEDFARRVSTSKVNKRVWESLIKAGGFDSFGERSDLLFNLENLMAFASKIQKEALSGQTNLFGGLTGDETVRPTVALQPAPAKYTEKEQLMWERELLGLYVSAHPLDNYDRYFEEQTVALGGITPQNDGSKVIIGGIISAVRTIVTKSGSKMAFVKLEDKTSEGEVIVFPNLFEQVGAKLVQDAVIRVAGKVSARDRDGNLGSEAKITADEVTIVTDQELHDYESTGRKMEAPKNKAVQATRVKSKAAAIRKRPNEVATAAILPALHATPKEVRKPLKKLFVHIKNTEDHAALMKLKELCAAYPGQDDIVLVLGEAKKSALRLPFKVDSSDKLIGALVRDLGEDCVVLK